MGIFDFLKKKEFAKIANLEEQLRIKDSQIESLIKYQAIIDIDNEIAEKLSKFEAKKQSLVEEHNTIIKNTETLRNSYDEAIKIYKSLKHQVDIFSESLEMAEYGIYAPHFDFDTSGRYKDEILSIRDKQKSLILKESAIIGGDTISWNGSLSQGQAMVKKEKKLMMRAFNGECDSFIANVEWNNVQRMIERIEKSYSSINKAYEKQGLLITYEYKGLKIDELYLSYEYKKKLYDEKEEQRAIREQMREEEKAQREIEVAKIKAEKEESMYQKAIEKARNEIEGSVGDKYDKLILQIKELEAKLSEAEQNKERALSMAQQTRRGHVYVISNIGSFGENIYKIGMTRRLEPMDRVKELGDASVPFSFDVHALIFSEDAPALENTLHKKFENQRVNLINLKREFFNVTLAEIEDEVIKNHGQIEFTKIAEAEQYRETLVIKSKLTNKKQTTIDEFPVGILN